MGAKGQCAEDELRRRLRLEKENSGGVPFPANPLVTKEEAMQACASLGSQMNNCVTDVRMANNPKATSVITQVFVEVENVLKRLKETPTTTKSGGDDTTTTTTASPSTTTSSLSSTTTTSVCLSVFAMLTVLFI